MAAGADSVKPILYALFANLSIAIAKFVAAAITSSSAMLAEGVHSLADTGNQVLLLLGIKRSRRPPSPDNPLGFGKAIYFWSFLVAVILFTIGGLFSIYEGLHKLEDPESLTSPWIAVGVLVFAIAAEGVSLLRCLHEVNRVRYGRSYWRWFRESRQSELIVVFGEDAAALLGLAIALVAILMTMATGNPLFDAIGTIGIGVLLVVIAVFVAIEVKSLLIGQGVERHVAINMRACLHYSPEIAEILNLITLQLGDRVMVAIKARMREAEDADRMVADINAVEVRFRRLFPEVMWLFFEPDVRS